MEQNQIRWMSPLIAGALLGGAGLMFGAWLTVRERSLLKAANNWLIGEVAQATDRVGALEDTNRTLVQELESVRAQLVQHELEYARLETAQRCAQMLASDAVCEDAFHPPMIAECDASTMEWRLADLECEIAALKEAVAAQRMTVGPGEQVAQSMESEPEIRMENAEVRQQCTAITKKGSRCSRPARSSGKCWQHGG